MWPVTLRCFISSAYAYMFAAADSIHFVAQVRNKGGLDSTRSCCLLPPARLAKYGQHIQGDARWGQPLCASVWFCCHTACEGKPIAFRSHGHQEYRGAVVGSTQVRRNCMHAQLDDVFDCRASAAQVGFLTARLHYMRSLAGTLKWQPGAL